MQHKSLTQYFWIVFSIVLAMLLDVLPLPSWGVWFRPHWILLVVMFWLLIAPSYFGIFGAWLVGLLVDLLSGTLFGTHALALALIAYLMLRFHPQIRMLHLFRQTLFIAFLAFVYLLVQFWVNDIAGLPLYSLKYWASWLTTVILWPWIYLLFQPEHADSSSKILHRL